MNNAAQGTEAILPADFFALTVCSAAVRYPNLIHPAGKPSQFSGNFRLNAEALLPESDLLQNVPTEHLVTGLHIRQIQIAEQHLFHD